MLALTPELCRPIQKIRRASPTRPIPTVSSVTSRIRGLLLLRIGSLEIRMTNTGDLSTWAWCLPSHRSRRCINGSWAGQLSLYSNLLKVLSLRAFHLFMGKPPWTKRRAPSLFHCACYAPQNHGGISPCRAYSPQADSNIILSSTKRASENMLKFWAKMGSQYGQAREHGWDTARLMETKSATGIIYHYSYLQ